MLFVACDGCTQAGGRNREQEEEGNRSPELWSWEQQWEREHCCSLLSLTAYLSCSLSAIPDNTRHSSAMAPIPGVGERGVPVIVARTSWALPTSTYWNTARVEQMLLDWGACVMKCDNQQEKLVWGQTPFLLF